MGRSPLAHLSQAFIFKVLSNNCLESLPWGNINPTYQMWKLRPRGVKQCPQRWIKSKERAASRLELPVVTDTMMTQLRRRRAGQGGGGFATQEPGLHRKLANTYCRRLSWGSQGRCPSRVSRFWSLSTTQDNLRDRTPE